MKKRMVLLLVAISLLLCLTACSQPLVGSWNANIGGDQGNMTLFRDGTGTITSNGIERPCTWDVKEFRLTVIQNMGDANYMFLDRVSFVLEKDTLTVTSYDGSKTLQFTKD